MSRAGWRDAQIDQSRLQCAEACELCLLLPSLLPHPTFHLQQAACCIPLLGSTELCVLPASIPYAEGTSTYAAACQFSISPLSCLLQQATDRRPACSL